MVIIIPARLGSTRLTSKALLNIGGKSMIRRVAHQAQCAANPRGLKVVVATDSELIADACGCTAVMTSAGCRSGTDRCYEAAKALELKDKDWVINVQGDQPFINQSDLSKFLTAVSAAEASDQMFTAFARSESVELHNEEGFVRRKFLHHIGLYAYRMDALKQIAEAPTHPEEEERKLEQMRAFHLGLRIRFVELSQVPVEINDLNDYEKVLAIIGAKYEGW